MRVEFAFAIYDGRPVVLEQNHGLPLVIHMFDSPEAALAFYERYRSEPLDRQRRAEILAQLERHGSTKAVIQ